MQSGMDFQSSGRCKFIRNFYIAPLFIRDLMYQNSQKNVIDVPVVCPGGQKPDQNGKCRDEWLIRSQVDTVSSTLLY